MGINHRPRGARFRSLGIALAFFLCVPCASFGAQNPQSPVQSSGPQPINDDFIRGDANNDQQVNIADATRILAHLFPVGNPTPAPNLLTCLDAADTNDDEGLDIADAVFLLGYLFSMGQQPASPFPDCGPDPSGNALTCLNYPTCVNGTDPDLVGHVLRRAAFGHTPELFDEVLANGAQQYVLDQLNGVYDDDEVGNVNQDLVNLLAEVDWQTTMSRVDLQKSVFARALLSREQLREVTTDFWDVHFSTYYWTVRGFFNSLPEYDSTASQQIATILEGEENQRFRDGAFGTFHDLLLDSAMGVPMVIYLDSYLNIAAEPNENYAREILELHTLGVDVLYTQDDVEELARCFTGWTICKKAPADVDDPHAPCLPNNDPTGIWTFHFDAANHDYDEKIIFEGNPVYELVIPAKTPGSPEGLDDALDVIAQLAGMTPTAEFVCTKLIQRFVADGPPPGGLLAQCLAVWGPEGDIAAVLEVILTSDEFLVGTDRWNLVETPYEYALSNARVLNTGLSLGNQESLLTDIYNMLRDTGNLPFLWNTPDGYPSFGLDQLGTSKLLERVDFNDEIFHSGLNPGYDVLTFLSDNGVSATDSAAIVDFVLDHFYQGNTNATDRQLAIDFLNSDELGNPSPLDVMAGNYEDRIRQFIVFVASFPQSQKQ